MTVVPAFWEKGFVNGHKENDLLMIYFNLVSVELCFHLFYLKWSWLVRCFGFVPDLCKISGGSTCLLFLSRVAASHVSQFAF